MINVAKTKAIRALTDIFDIGLPKVENDYSIAQQVQCSLDPKRYVALHRLSCQWVFSSTNWIAPSPVSIPPNGMREDFLLLFPSRVS